MIDPNPNLNLSKAVTNTRTVDQTEVTETKKDKLFNLPQLAGGALAAVTSAALGSRLGVAGTLAGAAIGSLVAAVASTLYTKGLEHTRDGVKRIVRRDAKGKPEVLEVSEGGRTRPATGWRRPLAITGGMALTAVASFVLAMGVITGWEFGSGQSLDGTGRTTVGQVGNGRASTKPSPTATTSASASSRPSASATTTEPATTEPSPSVTPTPTPTPTTAQPTPTPSGAATSEPAEQTAG